MGIFGRKSNQVDTKLDNLSTPEKFGNSWFYPIFGSASINWGGKDYLKDFLEVPEVNGIISLKVAAFANGILKITSDATGKEVANTDPIAKLLRNPNAYQSQAEFIQQTRFYKEIFGNELQYFLAPLGMNSSPKAWFSINPDIVEIQEGGNIAPFMTVENNAKYFYTWGGRKYEFPKGTIVHINRANVSNLGLYQTTATTVKNPEQSYLWGSSVLGANQGPIRNIRAAYEARNVLIENRGALGILSNAAEDGTKSLLPIQPELKKQLQDDYRRYGMTKGQMQIIMTSLNLKWQQMSIDTDKLKLFEEIIDDTKILCLGYGVPYDLISSGVTYDNKLRAERQFYQNTIIPDAMEWTDALNRHFQSAGKSWTITMTYDHLPVFQENVKERAQAMALMAGAFEKLLTQGVMTIDQAKQELTKFGIQ